MQDHAGEHWLWRSQRETFFEELFGFAWIERKTVLAKLGPSHSWRIRLGTTWRILRFPIHTAFLILLSIWLGGFWIIRYQNILTNDFLKSFDPPRAARNVAIVWVDKADHEAYFAGDSPMDPVRLTEAICAIERYRPKVVVVDFETSAAKFRNLPVARAWPNIIWGRPIYSVSKWDERAQRYDETYDLENVLGESSGPADYGLAVGIDSGDGAVRNFPRTIAFDGKVHPALHWRAVRKFREPDSKGPGEDAPTEPEDPAEMPELLRYSFTPVNLRDLADTVAAGLAGSGRPIIGNKEVRACLAGTPISPLDQAERGLGGKVVLFGGQFGYYDLHDTPFGAMWGPEILASGIEGELDGRGQVRHHISVAVKVGIKFVIALLIALMFWSMHPAWAVWAGLVLMGCLVVFGNVLAFVLGFEAAVVPFMVGVMIEQLVAVTHRAQHLSRGAHRNHCAAVDDSTEREGV
jgi:hypothetical protein